MNWDGNMCAGNGHVLFQGIITVVSCI